MINICNEKAPDTPSSHQQVFDETLDHQLLPVLSILKSSKHVEKPYRSYKRKKVLSKDSPIYSSKTCLKVSEHSFEQLPEDTSKHSQKKILLSIEVTDKSNYEEIVREYNQGKKQ